MLKKSRHPDGYPFHIHFDLFAVFLLCATRMWDYANCVARIVYPNTTCDITWTCSSAEHCRPNDYCELLLSVRHNREMFKARIVHLVHADDCSSMLFMFSFSIFCFHSVFVYAVPNVKFTGNRILVTDWMRDKRCRRRRLNSIQMKPILNFIGANLNFTWRCKI